MEDMFHTKQCIGVIPEAIVIMDKDCLVTNWNGKAVEILGVTEDDFIEKSQQIFNHFYTNRRYKDFFESSVSCIENLECSFKTKSGFTKYVSLNINKIYDSHGNVIGYIKSLTDVTLRKSMDQELKKFLIVVEQSANAIMITNNDGIIEYVNEAFELLTEYLKFEVIGAKSNILKSGYHPDSFYKELWETIINGEVWSGDMKNKKKDGSLYWEKAIITPIKNSNNEIINFLATKEDVTREKHLEEFKNNIGKIIRHDLKAPLSAVIGYPDLIKNDENITERQRDYLVKIRKSGKMMLNQINNSLNLYKIEEDNYQYSPVKKNVIPIIQDVIHDLTILASKKKITVSLMLNKNKIEDGDDGDIVELLCEEVLLYPIISNLLKNGIEASNKEKEIIINIDTQAGIILSFKNDGIIPESIRNSFFDKYVTSGKNNGTGLGTYSAKLMADVMGAEIEFETDVDEGTVVFVKFR